MTATVLWALSAMFTKRYSEAVAVTLIALWILNYGLEAWSHIETQDQLIITETKLQACEEGK